MRNYKHLAAPILALTATLTGLKKFNTTVDCEKDSDKSPAKSTQRKKHLPQLSTNDLESKFTNPKKLSLEEASQQADDLIKRVMMENGIPGISIAVSCNGKMTYHKGFGFSDLENHVICTEDTVMRIASISKPITMTLLAKLFEDGKVDMDRSLHEYIDDYPPLKCGGTELQSTITLRQLVSHLSGIRHYKKQNGNEKDGEFGNKEYLIRDHYNSVQESLALFNKDDLVNEPGSKFLYTTHGWTLISAIIEKIMNENFVEAMTNLFEELGLGQTFLDLADPIIYHRSRYYVKKDGKLINAPYVDISYKWAGGGLLSTVNDLVKFGNMMLYSYQWKKGFNQPAGYLKPDTVAMLWTPVEKTILSWDKDGKYGMGWGVVEENEIAPFCKKQRFYISHTGGAVGASSVLLILPAISSTFPSGIVVSMITNLQNISLSKTAFKIAQLFEKTNELQIQ